MEIYWPAVHHQQQQQQSYVTPPISAFNDLQLEEIGARRKGRKKGCKNRTTKERKEMKEFLRKTKNQKERERVRNIQTQYNQLRLALGEDVHKKLCKQKVLDSAIEYICKLTKLLADENSTAAGESTLVCNEEIVDDDQTSISSDVTPSPSSIINNFPSSAMSPTFTTLFHSPNAAAVYVASPPLTSFEFESPQFGSPMTPHNDYYNIPLFTSPPSLHDVSPKSTTSPYRLHHFDL